MLFSPEWIISEDDFLLVINKPSGLRSIPDGYDPQLPSLNKILEKHYGKLWVVHRLDKDTSGIMIFARTRTAHQIINRQFENRQILKFYHAITVGQPTWDQYRCDLPLRVNGDRKHRTVVDEKCGKPATTAFQLIARLSQYYSLISASPLTGYTHQIRTHLAAIGFPILFDNLYSPPQLISPSPDLESPRLALHASQIRFAHPADGAPVEFSAPYPSDFSFFIAGLKKERTI